MAEALSRPELIERRGRRALDLLVVPARIDQQAEIVMLGAFRARFQEAFGRLRPHWQIEGPSVAWEIPYLAHYSFRERVVARSDPKQQLGAAGMVAAYRNLSVTIERRLAPDSPPRSLAATGTTVPGSDMASAPAPLVAAQGGVPANSDAASPVSVAAESKAQPRTSHIRWIAITIALSVLTTLAAASSYVAVEARRTAKALDSAATAARVSQGKAEEERDVCRGDLTKCQSGETVTSLSAQIDKVRKQLNDALGEKFRSQEMLTQTQEQLAQAKASTEAAKRQIDGYSAQLGKTTDELKLCRGRGGPAAPP
jgi:hypothetical protein